jgi:hypothetical protein
VCAHASLRATGWMSRRGRRVAGVMSEACQAEQSMSRHASSLGDGGSQLGSLHALAGSSHWLESLPRAVISQAVHKNTQYSFILI